MNGEHTKPREALSEDQRVSDADLSRAIAAFQHAIDAMGDIPPGLTDGDYIALRAMRELQNLRRARQ